MKHAGESDLVLFLSVGESFDDPGPESITNNDNMNISLIYNTKVSEDKSFRICFFSTTGGVIEPLAFQYSYSFYGESHNWEG